MKRSPLSMNGPRRPIKSGTNSAALLSFPNCKINIGLHVTEKRDDGFHNIETIMVPAGWEDVLEINIAEKQLPEPEIKCTGIRVSGAKDLNLCIKAYKLLAKDFS